MQEGVARAYDCFQSSNSRSLLQSDSQSKFASAQPGLTTDVISMKQFRSILAYDAEWASLELTEQHAYLQAVNLLPEVPGNIYLGFPWATLIERLNSKLSAIDSLQKGLHCAKLLLNEPKHVITVCQHVDMLKYQEFFIDIGITHVFWTHAVKGQDCFSENEQIKIMPFPLLPVLETAFVPPPRAARKYLYSFFELRSKIKTLNTSTKMILDNLTGKQDGLVISFNEVDFAKILNDTRIHNDVGNDQKKIDREVPNEFVRILQESIFSLCPAGAGPNSERLWESIGCGSIPIVFSDNYLPPGSSALWELATVSCPERLEDILALPERLAAMACDKELLERKRHALRQLWLIYGPECFIYDILKLFLSFTGETADVGAPEMTLTYGRLYSMAAEINRIKTTERSVADVFILGCSSRVMSDPSGFLARYKENLDFRTAYKRALRSCNLGHAKSMAKALDFHQIVLEHIPSR